MTETVRITIPQAVAAFVRPGTSLEVRLRGAEGQPGLSPREQVLLLFCLSKDADQEVRARACATFAALHQDLVIAALAGGGWHPSVLHSLAVSHGFQPAVREHLLAQPELAEVTRSLLAAQSTPSSSASEPSNQQEQQEDEVAAGLCTEKADMSDEEGEAGEDGDSSEEEGEEFFSKYKLAQTMGIAEKIKMGLTGDKEWRKILIKDSNKLVSSSVIKNPRITDAEVLTIIKSGSPNDEVMRLICANKEWVKNYQIRKALIENPKTPLSNALRYLGTVNEKDLASYAKSRNISSVIATQAKRLLLNKKKQ